jgi:hypothetical protein
LFPKPEGTKYNSSDLFLVDYVYHANFDQHFHRVRRMTNLGGLMECQISDFITADLLPPIMFEE